MPTPRHPLKLFFCYAHKDKGCRDELAKWLMPMRRQRIIGQTFYDGEILAGDNWQKTIKSQLEKADIILLLVSTDFLASQYITKVELKRAMERHALGAALVIPVIVRQADEWKRTSLGKLQALPTGGRAIDKWRKKDEAWNDVTKGIRASIAAFCKRRAAVSNGIVRAEQFYKCERRLPGEVYAIELLKKAIGIERTLAGRLRITIDRTGVEEYIISNEGKAAKFREYKLEENREKILERDREIQSFLAGQNVGTFRICPWDPWDDLGLRLRWASGGVMSVIRQEGDLNKRWIPFFFRDIRPYGWNIALGSAERWFDEVGNQVPGSSIDHELNDPVNYILREFIEEAMILDDNPSKNNAPSQRGFRLRDSVIPIAQWGQYSANRLKLRQRDGLTIRGDGHGEIDVRGVETGCELVVKHGREEFLATDVLVCFSLPDLGIEVVKVKEYEIGKKDYFLDGEIQPGDKPGDWALVRMPMALLSLDYLRRIFGGNQKWQDYTEGSAPSIRVQSPPNVKKGEILLYTYDVGQRVRLFDSSRATTWERDRYQGWLREFGPYFVDKENKPSDANPSPLFVPGTAKILNLYFANCQD